MKEVLLVSTYESGFQSLGTTVAAAHLKKAEVPCRLLDLSLVSAPPPEELQSYGIVGFHVPMYHALPQSFNLASRIRTMEPRPKIFFFGLYASLFRDEILGKYGDQVFNTNWEDDLLEWVLGQNTAEGNGHGLVQLGSPAPIDAARPAYSYQRQERFLPPARELLPDLGNYARFLDGGARLLTGNVETTRGCLHPCTHCPLPPVYGGKVTLIPEEVVLADIDNLVHMGARHLSFIDPDFLNAPKHSLSIVQQMNDRYPFLTYDFTAKITHFRRHAEYVKQLAPLGLRYTLTAMEFNDDDTLDRLKKKHSTQDLQWSIEFLRSLGVHVKPTFVFINPWVSVEDMVNLLDFIEENDLIECVDPVQYKIRLLLFRNSLLLDGTYIDRSAFGKENDFYTDWRHEDPAIEELYRELVRVVDHHMAAGTSFYDSFHAVRRVVEGYLPSGARGSHAIAVRSRALREDVPRYDVPNFCCAEPTDENMLELKGLV